nr:hypothetical protein [uncultured Mediterranean phage uvMED]
MGYIGKFPTPQPLSATDIPDLPATKITSGTFPALNASNLTNLDAADLSGTLPALNGSALTNVSAGKVLQHTTTTSGSFGGVSNWNVNSSSMTSTNITSSITPTVSSSKIVGTGYVQYGCDSSSITHLQFGFQLKRTSDNSIKTGGHTSTGVSWDSEFNSSQQTRFDVYRVLPMFLYDSDHGGTSEITYRLLVRANSQSPQSQNRGGFLFMNLFEVA